MKNDELIRLEKILGEKNVGKLHSYVYRSSGLSEARYSLSSNGQIIKLNLEFFELSDITFLKEFPYLEELILDGNKIKNISCLQYLTNLKTLSLNQNKLLEIRALKHLVNLNTLLLNNNTIKSVSGLESLTALTHFEISNAKLSDFSCLKNLVNLKYLDLSKTSVNDISFIEELPKLKILNLERTPVNSISSMQRLCFLEKLDLAYSQVTNLSSLGNLRALKKLNISHNNCRDLAFVNKLKNLESLYLQNLQLDELEIRDLPNLKELNLWKSHLSALSLKNIPRINSLNLPELGLKRAHIDQMEMLHSLYIWSNNLSDVTLTNLPNLVNLNLGKNNITDPGFLNSLPKLNTLYLNNNKIESISLDSLCDLAYADISDNNIQYISLKNLPKLEFLNFNSNPLQTVLLNSLPLLKKLNLAHFDIEILEIKNLPSLTNLYLAYTGITDFSFLADLKKLLELDLTGTSFADYSILQNNPLLKILKIHTPPSDISSFESMTYLQQIYLMSSGDYADFVAHLRNKQLFPSLFSIGYKTSDVIDLEKATKCLLAPTFPGGVNDWIDNESYVINENSQVVGLRLRRKKLSDISFLKNFPKLEVLDLRINNITDISVIQYLGNLTELHLYKNEIKNIPTDFFDSLPRLKYINLARNPIKNIPQEIFDKDENVFDTLKIYLLSLQGERDYLHQAKMILVGNGEVGKSSIRIKLLDKKAPLPKKSERTQGLDITTYTARNLPTKLTQLPKPIDFDLAIWDFGGQGRYREVQQLFCGRKALYLFVTSVDDCPDKEDYVGFEYWLSMAKAYGYDKQENWQSPIIHVLNKYDLGKKPVDEAALSGTFNNIHDFVKISCETLYDFDKLEESIRAALPKISKDVFSNQFSKKWFKVKEELEKRRHENHISLPGYMEICTRHKLNHSEAGLWLDYLDRIGSIIYFRDNTELNNFIVLNPLWVKDCMYKILDCPIIKKGVLEKDFLPYIWKDYSEYEHANLLSLMLAYKFCYPRQDLQQNTSYIVPALLPENKPVLADSLFEYQYELKFDYKPFIPAGTVNKLIVQLNQYIYQDLKWKNGCILHLMDDNKISFGEVIEDWENKTVYLRIGGYDLHSIFIIIRSTLLQLLDELKKVRFLDSLEMETQIKVKDAYVPIKTIIDLGKENDYPFLFRRINQVTSAGHGRIKAAPKKLFISYAHDDITMRETLQQYLVNLERDGLVEIWQDGLINAGENWDDTIKARLEEADICILLLSQSIIASTYTHEVEFKAIMEKRKMQTAHIIPVLLRDCDWKNWKVYPPEILEKLGNDAEDYKISNFQFLPQEDKRLKAISKWPHPENAWLQVTDAIRAFCSA